MTDSEKLDLLLAEMQSMKDRIDDLESQVKQTERVLKNEIRKECALAFDEADRVHGILERHKADRTAHTA